MYKIHHKKRYKCILLKKDIPSDCILSMVDCTWFNKHKSEFYDYKHTCAIFKAIKGDDYLIIYDNHL